MRAVCAALAVVTRAFALGARGESSEEKAQNLDAIKNDLKFVSDAQADLSSNRRSEAEAGIVTAIQRLEVSYQKTFAPLNRD